MAISRQKEVRSRDYALLLSQMNSRVLYTAQYHRQHCTLNAFEQFGALHMHSHEIAIVIVVLIVMVMAIVIVMVMVMVIVIVIDGRVIVV